MAKEPVDPLDVRLPVMVSQVQADAIDAWRYENRIPSRAEAIRKLIDMGLKAADEAKARR